MAIGIFLSVKDVMVLKGYDNYYSAYRYLANFARDLKKPSVKSVTIEEFCDYHKIKPETVLKALYK